MTKVGFARARAPAPPAIFATPFDAFDRGDAPFHGVLPGREGGLQRLSRSERRRNAGRSGLDIEHLDGDGLAAHSLRSLACACVDFRVGQARTRSSDGRSARHARIERIKTARRSAVDGTRSEGVISHVGHDLRWPDVKRLGYEFEQDSFRQRLLSLAPHAAKMQHIRMFKRGVKQDIAVRGVPEQQMVIIDFSNRSVAKCIT